MTVSDTMRSAFRTVFAIAAILTVGCGTIAHAAQDRQDKTAAIAPRSPSASKEEGNVNTLSPGTFQAKQIVLDLNRSAAFYERVFGIVPAMRFKSVMNHRPMEEVLFKFPNGHHVPLVLIRFLDNDIVSHDQTVHVFFTDDIDSLIERVEQNGGRVTERRDDTQHRARIAFWYDPEGNLLETVQMY